MDSVTNIAQHAQRQDALDAQLHDLHVAACRFGMYDAADWLWKAALGRPAIGAIANVIEDIEAEQENA